LLTAREFSKATASKGALARTHDIQAAVGLDGLVDGGLDVCLLTDVGPEGDRLALLLLDELDGVLRGGLVDVGADDRSAFAGEEQGRLEADATLFRRSDGMGELRCGVAYTGSGDDGHAVGEAALS
jgi:hypothetical protein